MNKPTIQIILPIYKRLEITRICLKGIQRLQKDPRFIIRCLIVWSDYKDKQNLGNFVDNKLMQFVGLPNKPLGAKLNGAFQYAFQHCNRFDYIMQLGSDDLLSTDYLDKIEKKVQRKELFFGPDKLLMIEKASGKAKLLQAVDNMGAGRMIHRSLLEPFVKDKSFFDSNINKGLDNSLRKRIYTYHTITDEVYQKLIASTTPIVCDIKSETNIHSFDSMPGDEVDDRYHHLFPELDKIVYE